MALILVVDDDVDIRKYFVELLHRSGHEVLEAGDGREALRQAMLRRPQLVISDLLMPGMDGFELVRSLRSTAGLADTPVIFYTATFVEQEAFNLAQTCGAIHVVQKPCRSDVLLSKVNEALKHRPAGDRVRLDQKEFHSSHMSLLTNTLLHKVDELEVSNRRLAEAYDATLEGWVRALDMRDKETEGHSQRVSRVTTRLAGVAGIDEADLVHIRRGALLHDVGKLGVSDRILLKEGPLSPSERQEMERHPDMAHDMLRPIDYLRPALDIPYCHHEKWDGSGYPRGLRGEEIPWSARLFAVVDVWDALSSDRPYRAGWSSLDVNDYLWKQRDTHFDARTVDLFLAHPEIAGDELRNITFLQSEHETGVESTKG
jgi:putative two-component system response regulator